MLDFKNVQMSIRGKDGNYLNSFRFKKDILKIENFLERKIEKSIALFKAL